MIKRIRVQITSRKEFVGDNIDYDTNLSTSPLPSISQTAPFRSPITATLFELPSNCSQTSCVPVYRQILPSLCLEYRYVPIAEMFTELASSMILQYGTDISSQTTEPSVC